jgi:hypothetical protein
MADRGAFDLFAGLSALGGKDREWFDGLSEAGQKAAAPFVMMRWMSGTSDQAQIIRLNTCVNRYVFAGTADKEALFQLLAAAATGKNRRYSWLKGPSAKTKRLSLEVVKQYYELSTREASSYKVPPEDLIEMAEDLGWDKDEVSKLKKELDDGSGSTEGKGVKPSKPARGRRA